MHRPSCRVVGFALSIALLLPGVTRAGKGDRWPVSVPDDAGINAYLIAGSAYNVVELLDPENAARAFMLKTKVIEPLETALTNNPSNPLFASKLAEMLMLTEPTSARAQALIESSLKPTQDWIPGWLARGEWLLASGKLEDARAAFDVAEQAVNNTLVYAATEAHRRKRPPPTFFGLKLGPTEPTRKPGDPEQAEADRLDLLIAWMQVSERGSMADGGIRLTAPDQKSVVDPDTLIKRCRARIYFGRLRCEMAAGWADAARVDAGLTEVFRHDANFFPAKMLRVRTLIERGDFESAERVITPYVDLPQDNPMRDFPPVLVQGCRLYYAWHKATADRRLVTRFEELNDRLLAGERKDHFTGLMMRAEAYVDAAAMTRLPNRLDFARPSIDAAERSRSRDPAAVAQLRMRLEAVGKQLGVAPTTKPAK